MKKRKLVVVSGASGSGKTTLVDQLEREVAPRHLRRLQGVTTRDERVGDKGEYRYITRPFFEDLMTFKMFLWTKDVHGHLYGTAKQQLEQALASTDLTVAVLTPDCIPKMWEAAKSMGCTEEEMLFLHILSPGEDVLRRRLIGRGENEEAVEKRMADCREWDGYVRSLRIPVVLLTNDRSSQELRRQLQDVLKGA